MHLQNIQTQNTYGITDVRLVERLLPYSNDERQSQHAVRITIKTDAGRKTQLRDSIKSGSFDSSICRLKEEICKHYNLKNLSIEAKLLEEGCGLFEGKMSSFFKCYDSHALNFRYCRIVSN
jgi:hypothetical protein